MSKSWMKLSLLSVLKGETYAEEARWKRTAGIRVLPRMNLQRPPDRDNTESAQATSLRQRIKSESANKPAWYCASLGDNLDDWREKNKMKT